MNQKGTVLRLRGVKFVAPASCRRFSQPTLENKTPAGCRRHEIRTALVLIASGDTRQDFLIFFLLIVEQRAIGWQEGQLLLNDLVRIFRQVVDDGLDSDADA